MTAAKPRERGIVCSADEVRGLLDGRVSLLVRPMNGVAGGPEPDAKPYWPGMKRGGDFCRPEHCPFGRPGERRRVRESFNWSSADELAPGEKSVLCPERTGWRAPYAVYAADGFRNNPDHPEWGACRWRAATQMPLWASRLSVDITDVRISSLKRLSREAAIAAGARFTDYGVNECSMSADGGKTWGAVRSQKPGWSMIATASSGQCLGSPQMAFANWWNRSNHGKRSPWHPGTVSPWVWLICVKVAEVRT